MSATLSWRNVRKELGDTYVCAFVDDMEYQNSVQVHDVDEDAFIEAYVSCFKADAKAEWCSLYAFAWVALCGNLIQSFSSFPRGMIRAGLLDQVE